MTAAGIDLTTWPVDQVRADALDCLQTSFALLADHHHGVDAHLALGARLAFAPRPGLLPTVELGLDDHLAVATAVLGLRPVLRATVTAAELDAPLSAHGVLYVVADAYHLPWVPYAGHRHMTHSFLLAASPGGYHAVDAYHNETEWGPARPGTCPLRRDQLATALPNGAEIIALAPTPPTGRAEDIVATTATARSIDEYVDAYRDHPDRVDALDRLTLQTWLLARARRLHAAFRARAEGVQRPEIAEHLRRWDRLTEQTYLAYRRVLRGRPEPAAVLDRLATLLAEDVPVFTGLRGRIAAAAAEVLGAPPTELLAGVPFVDVPGFSSFRLVEIVERIEDRLGVLFDPDDLVPENLHDVTTLCRIVTNVRREP